MKLEGEGENCSQDVPLMQEPTFIIRAQDRLAPDIIEEWARRLDNAVENTVSQKADMSRKKASDARALAHEMREWQERHHCKVPD